MPNNDKFYKLYNGVINRETLTNKLLNDYGFDSVEIKELVDSGRIVSTVNGCYVFKSYKDLYEYGKLLLVTNSDFNLAYSCFSYCYDNDYNQIKILSTLFFHYINIGKYDEALKNLFQLLKNPNNIYLHNNLLYVYLLSFIIKIPVEYNKFLDKLNFNYKTVNCDLNCELAQNITFNKEIVEALARQKFKLAYNKNNKFMNENGLSYEGLLLKRILKKIISLEQDNNQKLIDFITNENYDAAMTFFEEEEERHQLSIMDIYIKKLVLDLISIENNKVIIKSDCKRQHNFFKAIDCRDYELALKLNKSYNSECENKMEITPIVLLLQNLIKKTNKNNRLFIYDKRNSLYKLFRCLKCYDIKQSTIYLHNYLEDTNNLQYEPFVNNLISLSLLEGDKFFVKPLMYLTSIDDRRYFMNLDNYIESFNYDIENNNFERAIIYLDIICNLNEINDAKVVETTQLLELKRQLVECKEHMCYDINTLKLKI